MRKCLIITVHGSVQTVAQKNTIQKHAQTLFIEGTLQSQEDGVIIHACGISDNLDKFIDTIYGVIDKSKIKNVEAEPFISEKGYRGAFRIIG